MFKMHKEGSPWSPALAGSILPQPSAAGTMALTSVPVEWIAAMTFVAGTYALGYLALLQKVLC